MVCVFLAMGVFHSWLSTGQTSPTSAVGSSVPESTPSPKIIVIPTLTRTPTLIATPTTQIETKGGEENMVEIAVIEMEKGGIIKFVFFPNEAPNTVENFKKLTKQGFYDGLTFHRVEPGFVVQGGDPKGNGTGGPGYTIKAEFNRRRHLTGTVAMARAQHPDSAGSQFYICLAPQPFLDGNYTVFGQVFEGMEVVNRIKVGDRMRSVTIQQIPASQLPKIPE